MYQYTEVFEETRSINAIKFSSFRRWLKKRWVLPREMRSKDGFIHRLSLRHHNKSKDNHNNKKYRQKPKTKDKNQKISRIVREQSFSAI